ELLSSQILVCLRGGDARRVTTKNPGGKGTCDLGGGSGLAPRTGFEPVTLRLTAACSTVELPRNGVAPREPLAQPQQRGIYTGWGCDVKSFVALATVCDAVASALTEQGPLLPGLNPGSNGPCS